ncbi:DsbA family protein [Chitinophaga sp. MM2321]|uniref:DsbA family protein n=1 Tax=Chitinophaga sp. MM2321 TaxID=3137178 RepID=UPI0032D59FDA
MMKDTNKINPLLCDPVTGVCEIPGIAGNPEKQMISTSTKAIKIIYFTDPICSTCWGIEPQLRKLKLEYGDLIEIDYRMGGLLPSWDIYNSGGIGKPSDVAHHWDEVSAYYDAPIDGDVWLEDPLSSSFPPSIAFKAAQMQDTEKAVSFLRISREMLFLEKKNITRWEHIERAALEAGLDPLQLKTDYEGKAAQLFKEDLELARQMGVRGFPSLFFSDASNKQVFVYGYKPYAVYEKAILELLPEAEKQQADTTWEGLFKHYSSLFTKEFSVLSNKTTAVAEEELNNLYSQQKLEKKVTKNGILWTLRSAGQ